MDNKDLILTDWIIGYTKAIIDALQPKGDFLQIGFGAGLNQDQIKKCALKKYVIIENEPSLVLDARLWAKSVPNVEIIEGPWKTALPKLGTFDAIFYNDYPNNEEKIHLMNFLFPQDVIAFNLEAKKLIDMIAEEISGCKRQFTDKEMEEFFQSKGKHHPQEFPDFIKKLKENGNITKAQYEKYLKKKLEPAKKVVKTDPMLQCLKECLKKHLKKGGRFTAFLNDQRSKYNDAPFFEEIITNADLDYQEINAKVKTTEKDIDSLIMIVEKS